MSLTAISSSVEGIRVGTVDLNTSAQRYRSIARTQEVPVEFEPMIFRFDRRAAIIHSSEACGHLLLVDNLIACGLLN